MDKKIKVAIFGGFHNVAEPIIILVDKHVYENYKIYNSDNISEILDNVSERTQRKVFKHMCGVADCHCGIFNWKIEKVTKS